MLGTKISPMDKTLVNSKMNIASNVLNIIQSVIMFVIFALIIIIICFNYYSKYKRIIINIKDRNILENFAGNDEEILYRFCCFIPFLLAIALKFVFGIINDRNILQSKIVKNGLLFLILNIFLFVLSIFLIIDFFIIEKLAKMFEEFVSFNKYLYFIISLLCLVVAIFTIVDRIRQKNTIHLFFLIFYTIVIAINCVSSVLFLISIYKDEKEEKNHRKTQRGSRNQDPILRQPQTKQFNNPFNNQQLNQGHKIMLE